MAEINIWLDNPDSPAINLKVGNGISISRLKAELMARSNLSAFGTDAHPVNYEILCLRTGTILRGDSDPISYLVRDGDRFVLQKSSNNIRLDNSTEIAVPEQIVSIKSKPLAGVFSVTGVAPFALDFSSEYPVLAICIKSYFAGLTRRVVSKDTLLLIADINNRLRWESADKIGYFIPGGNIFDLLNSRKRLTRYSVEKQGKEPKNMLYPVRPFSITGITLDGFDSKKEYPVLAIDTDQYLGETQHVEDTENSDPQSGSQFLAFFLVGNDVGEFAWIAEDECLLFPLK
jgi:hypothetical protein